MHTIALRLCLFDVLDSYDCCDCLRVIMVGARLACAVSVELTSASCILTILYDLVLLE